MQCFTIDIKNLYPQCIKIKIKQKTRLSYLYLHSMERVGSDFRIFGRQVSMVYTLHACIFNPIHASIIIILLLQLHCIR